MISLSDDVVDSMLVRVVASMYCCRFAFRTQIDRQMTAMITPTQISFRTRPSSVSRYLNPCRLVVWQYLEAEIVETKCHFQKLPRFLVSDWLSDS